MRSDSTTAPHPQTKRKKTRMIYLDDARVRDVASTITTLEVTSLSARSTKHAPNAHAHPKPKRMTTENSAELDASADLFGEHECREISSFLRTLRSSMARRTRRCGSATTCRPSSCMAETKTPPY